MEQIRYQQMNPDHFVRIIALGNQVHGDNYLDPAQLAQLYHSGIADEINASWVALAADALVGFRLTQAAGNWLIDNWCSPDLWGIAQDKVCYFKCNTVAQEFRAKGIGSRLLTLSIQQAKKQGAQAGLAHIWLASPGNSAFRYFSKCGGKLIKQHANKWLTLSSQTDYACPVCCGPCKCSAAEMLLRFN